MAELTTSQHFKLDIYKLVQMNNAATQEAFQFIGEDSMKLELFKIHYNQSNASPDVVARTIEAVRKAQESLDLFGA